MKTIEERINLMYDIKNLIDEWFKTVENAGNECAYTDSIIELIQKEVNEL